MLNCEQKQSKAEYKQITNQKLYVSCKETFMYNIFLFGGVMVPFVRSNQCIFLKYTKLLIVILMFNTECPRLRAQQNYVRESNLIP